jgi:hypothetical protein
MIDRSRLEKRARMMQRINVPMRAILGLPFPTPLSRRLMLLEYTGRKDCSRLPAAGELRPRRRHAPHARRRAMDRQPA